jgi:hypothetical protein
MQHRAVSGRAKCGSSRERVKSEKTGFSEKPVFYYFIKKNSIA